MVEVSGEEYFTWSEVPLVARSRAKRIFDATGALLLLIFLLPLFLTVALLIVLDSRGPVLFRQMRAGLNQRPFCIYKFRTMSVMEDGDTVTQAERYDSRITRIGAFLRRSSIDELPQLINVLKGDMSLVGPRPHALAHDREYSQRLTDYAARFRAKPGITGWAQVHGLRGRTDALEMMERRVEFDNHYIEHWTFGLDAMIFMRTVLVFPFQQSAY